MIGLGFAEVLMLALLSGGIGSNDLVSLVQPTHYFQTRQIEVTIDKMVELAGREPKDATTQIQQLVALRHLTDETDSLKKATNYPAHRQALEQIAQGKKGADPLGFAQDYAQRVLGKLDGTKREPVKTKPIRQDALSWFPADVSLGMALDMRQTHVLAGDPLKELLKLMPEREKKEMYDHIEKSGNLRIERVAFGFADSAGKRGDMKIFMRFTGKGNQAWVLEAFKMLEGGRMQAKQIKDDKGTPITIMQDGDNPPVVMLVGNTDVLVFGYDGGNDGKNEKLIAEVLDARSGRKPNAAVGVLKNRLAKIPDKAVAFGVGELPKEFGRELRFIFDPMPSNITAFIERTQTGMDVQVETTMANRDDADKVVGKISDCASRGSPVCRKR